MQTRSESATNESRISALSDLSSRVPILLIACWMVLFLPRSFLLGLYYDDWWSLIKPVRATAPFSLERLQQFVGFQTAYGPRPLLGLFAYLATLISGPSPVALQLISALLVLAAALSLRAWLNQVMGVFPQYRNLMGDFAAIFWMSLPAMMGTTAWPMVAHNLGCQILVTETMRMVLKRERMTIGVAALLAGGLTASGLIYEAFYFAIFPIAVFYAVCRRGPAQNRLEAALLLGACCFAQALPIAFNRYAAHIHAAATKTFNPSWPKMAVGNFLSLPNTLFNSFHEYRFVAGLLILCIVVCASAIGMAGRHRDSHHPLLTYLLGLLGVAAAMLLIGIVLYSAAGFGFEPFGSGSRSLLVPSFAATVAFFALICTVFVPGEQAAKSALLGAAAALVLVLAIAQRNRVAEWAYVWKEEQRILNGVPWNELVRVPSDASILFVGPPRYADMAPFDSPWDLTAAISTAPPRNGAAKPNEILYPAASPDSWAWDGAMLVHRSKWGVQRFAVTKLYIWREGVPGVEPVAPGFGWPEAGR